MNKKSAMINFFVLGGLPFFGMFMFLILPTTRESWIGLLIVSFILIAIGKVSQFKKGKWISFGSNDMDKPYKYVYQLGWLLFIFAMIIGFAVFRSHA